MNWIKIIKKKCTWKSWETLSSSCWSSSTWNAKAEEKEERLEFSWTFKKDTSKEEVKIKALRLLRKWAWFEFEEEGEEGWWVGLGTGDGILCRAQNTPMAAECWLVLRFLF